MMNSIVFKISEPIHENTIYLDKDGVLNTAFYRSNKLSSPRSVKEIKIKKDLKDILDFSEKKNLI